MKDSTVCVSPGVHPHDSKSYLETALNSVSLAQAFSPFEVDISNDALSIAPRDPGLEAHRFPSLLRHDREAYCYL